jgi:bifunctional DNase/RNase
MGRAVRSVPSAVRVVAVLAALLGGCHRASPDDAALVPVRVGMVMLDRDGAPVVLLEERGGTRTLPIWIGLAEARSIANELAHQRSERPSTHDFVKALLDRLDGRVRRVVVTDVRDGTYYASVEVEERGRSISLDARPSDAIALALRFGAPIFVHEGLFEPARPERPPTRGGERSA